MRLDKLMDDVPDKGAGPQSGYPHTSNAVLACFLKDAHDRQHLQALRRIYAEIGDSVLWQVSCLNRVESIVAHRLMLSLGEASALDHWRRAHRETYHLISTYLAELDRIATRLADEGISLVVLKNGGIARCIYPCLGCCPMGDLDVLVERRHFCHAHQILLAEGYNFEFRSLLEKADLKAAEQSGGAEYWKTLPDGETLWFELQWRPVAGRWIRPDQEPSAEELMARSVPISGTAVRLLSPEDNLLQIALHTAKHSYVRAPGIRLHLDVERIVRHQAVNWDLFLSRASVLRVKTPVYFSLAIPKALFGTPIPEDVLDVLCPPAWKERLLARWIQRASLFDPDERKFSRLGYVLFASLLYDDLRGLWRALFPDRAWMRGRYGCHNDLLLPYYHGCRLLDLIFRRGPA